MSYILDALRKADAERERDPSRGIHAHPVASAAERESAKPAVWMAVAGAVVVLAAAWAWTVSGRAPEDAARTTAAAVVQPVVQPVAQPAVQSAAQTSAQSALQATQPASPMETVAPREQAPAQQTPAMLPPPPPVAGPVAPRVAVARSAAPQPAIAPQVVAAPQVPNAPQAAAAAQTAVAPQAATAPQKTAAPQMKPAAPAAASAPVADRILSVAELPADIVRDLPKLPITGGVYSENVAQRMLVVNGQVVNEGAEIAPGLVLEQIRPKSAVMRFRGLRYSIGY